MKRPLPALGILVATVYVLVASCEGKNDTTAPPLDEPTIAATGSGQTGVAGTALTVPLAVELRSGQGTPLAGAAVQFTVVSGGGAVTDTTLATGTDGRAAVTWFLGPDPTTSQLVRASAGDLEASFTATAISPNPATTYYGRNQYIEYAPGDLPIVISAPHGGLLEPAEIPNRTFGETVRDRETEELIRAIGVALQGRTGTRPHIVITRLRRTKLDANREVVEAAQGNPAAERAWFEYHTFIEAAKRAVVSEHGHGLYIDLHGHGHPIQRLELGYLLTGATLRLPDATLDQGVYEDQSSLRTLSQRSAATFAGIVRGPMSLGTLLEDAGFPAVPSATQTAPAIGDPYFNGGYSTVRHGSSAGGQISGLQIETNYTGVRDTPTNRAAFAAALAAALESYLGAHAGLDITPLAVR